MHNSQRFFSRAGYASASFSTLGAGAVLFYLIGTGSAFAIPSPELVVGSFTSISQLFALGSALLGGGATVATLRMRSRGAQARSILAVALGAFVLLAVSVGLNIYQYTSYSGDKQARLEATLTLPMPNIGGRSLDPTLKEVSYGDQLKHPRGISTGAAEELLGATLRGERPDVMFLDIREAAETEMGSLPGATAIRFPDLPSAKLDLAGKTAILFCHNGNRGYETCQAMAALGIDCRFLVGGLEKWLVEKRSLTGLNARTLDDLRGVPPNRNQKVLLDTPDVHHLVANEGAIFVDVRYPGEFASGSIPGAINLPIRPTPTKQLKERIAQLPHKPIIAPCYDRRSCFFSEVLGLELERAGYDYRGKYTLPWEYSIPSKPRPYIEEWLKEAHKSWWAKASDRLAYVLTSLGGWIGIIPAVLLLAIISRLLVLPFSVKAERDQIKSRAVEDELVDLKARLKEDPPRLTRAISGFYKRHGITPMRNLIALLFLPIMALALTAVQKAVSTDSDQFAWISNLAERDHWFALPVLFAALISLYIDMAFVRTRWHRLAVWAAVFPLFIATGALFSAGTDVYLVMSAALLIVQRIWVSGLVPRLWQAWRRSRLEPGVYLLDDVQSLAGYGNKAYRLAQMRAAGMPVPDGVLLTQRFLGDFAMYAPDERRATLDRLWRRLYSHRLAVRSSASGEDSANNSFAGVFESVLDVDRDGLEAAIRKVQESFEAARVKSYAATGGTGSVLMQRMIAAEYAGVLFTRDPSAGGLVMVEMVKGTAENLVSGTVRPWTFRCGRVTGKQFGDGVAPIDLAPLLALGRRAEELFGCPQDIEWTYAAGSYHLVQSRDITRVLAGEGDESAVKADLARVLDLAKGAAPDEGVFAKNELSEMLPRPTPLSLSLMEALWASGGSVDRAARNLGFSYRVAEDSTYLVTILGRLYVDKREEKSRGFSIGPIASRKLMRGADRIEREFREEFLPRFLVDIRLAETADFNRLSTPELVEEIVRLRDRFAYETHVEVDAINIAANFYLDRARRELTAAGLDPSSFLGHIPETFEGHAIAEAAAAPAESRHWFLIRSIGHRAAFDYELAEPRYSENRDLLTGLVVAKGGMSRPAAPADEGLSKRLAKLVGIARRFQALKEDAKHHSLRELATLRRAVLALDRQLGLGGLVFHLTFDELAKMCSREAEALRSMALRRQDEAARLRTADSLSSALTPFELEAVSAGSAAGAHESGGVIRGTRVSGSRVVEARACVISEAEVEHCSVLVDFRDGDIIVAPMINPSWLPYFSRAGGFVSEVGGWLSHTAILAREHDVAMIVAADGLSNIANGSLLRLHLDGQVEVLEQQEPQVISKMAAE
jgi:rhodanese-related sulfurtransferase/membrane protein insertase Oxa1/YidC/SpoIIIJ/phosphohistidine swiveling domain-containing protein/molybdenum-dependent DNA-binding transcriptional regulator ModE